MQLQSTARKQLHRKHSVSSCRQSMHVQLHGKHSVQGSWLCSHGLVACLLLLWEGLGFRVLELTLNPNAPAAVLMCLAQGIAALMHNMQKGAAACHTCDVNMPCDCQTDNDA